ncbi:MAG: hypothetical protein QM538_02525 [Methylacidiphilales bacterium]|nr:hypothetical protein [Candidatus Methylacidiphilales bacterium]
MKNVNTCLLLIDYWYLVEPNDISILQNISKEMKLLLSSNIHDCLGGGFFENSTSAHPNQYIKLLSTNALLISSYARLFGLTQLLEFRIVVEKSINCLQSTLLVPIGLLGESSRPQDLANNQYLVHPKTIFQALNEAQLKYITEYMQITSPQSLDQLQLLTPQVSIKALTKHSTNSIQEIHGVVLEGIATLADERKKQLRLEIDTSCGVGSNALFTIALYDAGRFLSNNNYIHYAHTSVQILIDNFFKDDRLHFNSLQDANLVLQALLYNLQFRFDYSLFQVVIQIANQVEQLLNDQSETATHTITHPTLFENLKLIAFLSGNNSLLHVCNTYQINLNRMVENNQPLQPDQALTLYTLNHCTDIIIIFGNTIAEIDNWFQYLIIGYHPNRKIFKLYPTKTTIINHQFQEWINSSSTCAVLFKNGTPSQTFTKLLDIVKAIDSPIHENCIGAQLEL